MRSLFPVVESPPTELQRVLAMPQETLCGEELAEIWTRKLGTANALLRPVQALALQGIYTYKTLFGSIGVGHGKGLICLLAGTAAGAQRPLLLVPPSLVEQTEREIQIWSKVFRFVPPEVLSYGKLSTTKGTALLETLQPDLIIADECHYLRHKNSSRTKRVLRYFRQHPQAGFVGVSGTITSRSLLDYSHLLELCLRDRAPIPLSRDTLEEWASCIDPQGEPVHADWVRIWPLVVWAGGSDFMPEDRVQRREAVRKAYRDRLSSTPGVVCTVQASCEASLHIIQHKPSLNEGTKEALKTLHTSWETPEGEPLTDAASVARAGKQLALGFYYKWVWEDSPDLEWLDRRRAWSRAISGVLRYSSREGLDSPALVRCWVESGNGSKDVQEVWRDWKEVCHKPAPLTEAVWIDRGPLIYALDWLADSEAPAMLWYQSRAVAEALASFGVRVMGAGSPCPSTLKGYPRKVAASLAVHGEGRNLQGYHRGLVLECPSSGKAWEQLIGRYHRALQQSHLVEWHLYQHTHTLVRSLEKSRADALYIEHTQGQKQKLNIAQYLWA